MASKLLVKFPKNGDAKTDHKNPPESPWRLMLLPSDGQSSSAQSERAVVQQIHAFLPRTPMCNVGNPGHKPTMTRDG
jgi:hypothetical protein